MGYIENGRFTGDVVYHIQAQGRVYHPPAGFLLEGIVIRKNKMGMYASFENPNSNYFQRFTFAK
jgi:hypothetical protein